jgi:hypothetical protein
MPPIYRESVEMRKQFARVYNSIKLTDNRIGELLARLEKDKLRDSTIIFFYADHGEGEPRGKTDGIDYGYRVPFVIWFPEMYKHLSPWGTSGIVSDELINFEDLAPTVLALAGAEIPDYLKGRKLIGENRSPKTNHLILSADRADNGIDMVRTITDGRFVYSRNFMPFIPQARYIRYMEISEIVQQMRSDLKENKLDSLQKSIFEDRPAEFLFDIENDLWETRNLADDSKYNNVLEKMRKLLDYEILSAKDVMFLPEYEIGLISQKGTPYEFRLDESKYPLNEIYKVALLSGIRNAETTKQQIQWLENGNKIIRYWAIIGLHSQSDEILKAFQHKIEKAISDNYPPVSLAAAALLYRLNQNSNAKNKLLEASQSENLDISLLTINFLMYEKNKQPFIETIKKVHQMPDRNYNVKAACMDFLGSLGLVPNNFENRE